MSQKHSQSGFSLLVFLVILMGVGGVALAGFAQKILKEVKAKEVAHNQEVLRQAKQALLMYAYRYPSIALNFNGTFRGPGRLPCPDTDNNGNPDPPCNALNGPVGRFPWVANGMDFFDARDHSGERLWYAVSDAFQNNSAGSVNSDTLGSITILDQTGSILYDGSAAGVAAVIIAPGPAINAQDRSILNTDDPDDLTIDTDPGIVNPANYLDAFGGFDNSVFMNLSNLVADAFVRGPVFDPVENSVVINDQMVIITAQEVIAMAEKAALEAYRDAIRVYLENTGGIYPWLFDYASLDLDSFNSGTTNIGRIPSIFSTYFADANSRSIDTEIMLTTVKTFQVETEDPLVTRSLILSGVETTVSNVRFTDAGVGEDDIGLLIGDPVAGFTADDSWFFWKDSGDWVLCAGGGKALSDCNQDSSGTPTPGSATNDSDIDVLRVGLRLDYTAGIGFTLDYSDPLAPAPPMALTHSAATALDHASILASFAPAQVQALPVEVYYEEGNYSSSTVFTVNSSGQQEMTNDTDFFPVINQTSSNVNIRMRYYPELPAWAHSTENDWHNSIQMAVSPANQPGGGGNCASPPLPPPGLCLEVNDMVVGTDDITALLVIAGQHDLIDGVPPFVPPLPGVPPDGYANDLQDIFEAENANLDLIFSGRTGNDKVLVIQ